MPRIGFIGPTTHAENSEELREAIEFLLGDAETDQTIYLGEDRAITRLVDAEIQALSVDDDFLGAAAALALSGSPSAIESWLERQTRVDRLSRLRVLPPSPARAIEMLGDRIVLVVHDKATLDEDDIASASVVVYGRSEELIFRRFGSRYFFSPGPLERGVVGLLEVDEQERIVLSAFQTSGEPVWTETLVGRRQRMSIL